METKSLSESGVCPHYGSLPFESSMSSPKPPSCSGSAYASLTTRASTSHCISVGRVVSLIGHWVLERSGGLFPLFGLLPPGWSKKLGIFQNNPSGNVIFPVVEGGDSVSSPSYSDSERDMVHTAFSITTAINDSGRRKGGDQLHVYFPVGVRGINKSTLIR